jgi:acyl-coenzyme A thioesterase PaaI-like protein
VTAAIVIAPRFRGPPEAGNGGYLCGLISAHVDGPAEVTLRRPAPLATDLAVERGDDGSVRVLDGPDLVAEGVRVPGGVATDPPSPVSIQVARAAGASSRLRFYPSEHPFPTCFVCGPDRRPGDGLRIIVGRVAGRDLSADVWHPSPGLAHSDGTIRPEFLWAALDCAGGIGAAGDSFNCQPYVLGRLSARLLGPVTAGEPHVVVGWRLATEGRKIMAGSALFTAGGQAVAVARATWIRLRRPASECCPR